MKNSRYLSRTNLILAAIIFIALFFRFYRLDQMPPGFQFDQAFYVFDSLRLLQGQFSIFFAAPGGSEPLFLYLSMVGVSLAGVTPLGIRLTSAILGVVTIPLIFGLARTVFRSTRVGLLAAFFASYSVWNIFYGRYGERITLLVLLVVPMFWFLWRAVIKREMRDYALAGFFLALGLYTNLAGRLLPFSVILMTAYMAWSDRKHARDYVKGLVVAGVVSLVIFIPLGVYFVQHPGDFFSHAAQVSIFVPHANEQGDVPAALTRNALRLLGMFIVQGDDGMIRNVPHRPVFDPLVGALFVAGVVVMLGSAFWPRANEMSRRHAALLLSWLAAGMAVALITDDAPNFDRLQPIIPAVMIIPAWGAAEIYDRLRAPAIRRVAAAVFAVIAIASPLLAYRDYFVVLGNDPGLYYAFNTDKVEISNWINQGTAKEHMFLAPVFYQVGTISLLTRTAPLKTFESRDTIILPSSAAGKDAVYAFPLEQKRKAETMQERLGALATREEFQGSNGDQLLVNLRVPVSNLPDPADPMPALARGGDFTHPQHVTRTNIGDEVEIFGSTVSPEGPGGRNLTVTLFLRALKPMTQDYTFSIKVRDDKGRTFGQEDKWAGDNSYATTAWSPGDIIVEKFYPGLNACAPAGKYEVTAEIYNPTTGAVLTLADGSGSTARLGSLSAGPSEGNRYEDLEIDNPLDAKISDRLQMAGYNIAPDTVSRGGIMSLALFWRGIDSGSVEKLAIRVGNTTVAERQVSVPAEGRGLCTLYDITLPQDTPAGKQDVSANGFKITDVQVTP